MYIPNTLNIYSKCPTSVTQIILLGELYVVEYIPRYLADDRVHSKALHEK